MQHTGDGAEGAQEMGEEQICDFMATYADDIILIADRYMKKSIKK